ncbi:uncharacterized protein TNCT_354881 [Trichonephila clavata]|uniref:Uncharacterized protein n=1 Tax=Trichonephila clavata TaxID=2740835 RepID=A0A8X6FH40_TRICU|nr:uncharacterized protein TNCT_354881 [Trichonephila clavata]
MISTAQRNSTGCPDFELNHTSLLGSIIAHDSLHQAMKSALFWSVCGTDSLDVNTSTSELTTDYDINSVNEDFYTSYGERNTDNPSSRRAGSFYKRRPYSNPMPECASQQVCNAVFMRLKFVQPLCRCPNGMKNPCSTRMHPNDGHTVNLLADKDGQKTQTLIKVCEDVSTVKICQEPHDWMLLALQNVRTGKAHYLVVCKCPTHGVMEGPVLHTQPPYARIPGISVYGMLCVQGRKSRLHKESEYP